MPNRTASITAAFVLAAVSAGADPALRLAYDAPAQKWTEALPLGNGRIGAMVFGGTEEERLQITEGTLWGVSVSARLVAGIVG